MKNNTPFKSGYSLVNGINMYYEIHGNGDAPLVLIHGGGSTIGTTFGTILPLFATHFTVLAMELQAHGHTDDRETPESFEQDADDVAALLKNLGIERASFLGFSNGGNTAMQLAFRHPAIVHKLILASTFYKREGFFPGFFEGMAAATLTDMPKILQDAFFEINPDMDKLMTMFNKDRQRMVEFTDWPDEWLASITAPALIINGDKDVILNSHAVRMSSLIGQSRLMILPATHGSYIGAAESPGDDHLVMLTANVIVRFLKE
jgi:pimeloyl-ACP methyl ester carboxylesterase